MNILVPFAFVAIIGSLVAALVFMLRPSRGAEPLDEHQRARRMARALAFRVGFSISLFLLVLLAWAMGWIQPTGIVQGQ